MDPSKAAATALETIARDAAEKYGVEIVLVAMRAILKDHLTAEGAAAAEEAADALWNEQKRSG